MVLNDPRVHHEQPDAVHDCESRLLLQEAGGGTGVGGAGGVGVGGVGAGGSGNGTSGHIVRFEKAMSQVAFN